MKTIAVLYLSFFLVLFILEAKSAPRSDCEFTFDRQTFELESYLSDTPEANMVIATVRYRYVNCNGNIDVELDYGSIAKYTERYLPIETARLCS